MKVKVKPLSRVRLLATPWTTAAQFHANQHNFMENNSKALTKFLNHQYLLLYLYNDINTSSYIPENILKINQGNICEHLPDINTSTYIPENILKINQGYVCEHKGFLMNLKEKFGNEN